MNKVSASVVPPFRTAASRLTASLYSSNLAQSWSLSAYPISLDLGLKVHLQTRSITASKYSFRQRQWVHGNIRVTEVDRVMGSILTSAHFHLILSYYENTHTIFPNCWSHSLCPRCCDRRNWKDHQCQVVSHLLTRFLCSSNQNRYFSWVPFRCRRRCGGLTIACALPSSSIVSPQRPPSGVSLSSLNGRVHMLLWLCSTTICGQIDRMHIYTETYIMHAILWCSKSCDCNKDEYYKPKCLVDV